MAVLSQKNRFPTTLGLASISFANFAQAGALLLQRFRWLKVTVISQYYHPPDGRNVAIEVMRGIFVGVFRKNLDINALYESCDPEDDNSIRDALKASRKFSTGMGIFVLP